jgi:hypothetical protein
MFGLYYLIRDVFVAIAALGGTLARFYGNSARKRNWLPHLFSASPELLDFGYLAGALRQLKNEEALNERSDI